MDLITFLLDHAGICQQEAIIIVTYALVGERIGVWNIHKKQDTEVEYVAMKIKY